MDLPNDKKKKDSSSETGTSRELTCGPNIFQRDFDREEEATGMAPT